jgi:hypothetical protein
MPPNAFRNTVSLKQTLQFFMHIAGKVKTERRLRKIYKNLSGQVLFPIIVLFLFCGTGNGVRFFNLFISLNLNFTELYILIQICSNGF